MGWRPPKPDGFQLNSDGALRCNSTQTAAGGLIRDHNGNRVAGYCRNIGAATCFTAEIWGLRDGLQLATRFQLPNLEIETDSMVMMQSLATPCQETQQLNAILNDWQVHIAAGKTIAGTYSSS